MKNIKERTERKNNHTLEELCPFAEECSESNYGSYEVCDNDYKICRTYSLLENGGKKR